MIKAAIFDVDGTLVDSVDLHARAWQEAFAAFGHDIEFATIRSQIGKGGDQLMSVFLSDAERAARGKSLDAHRTRLLKQNYLEQIRPFPEVPALFERLRRDGIAVVLASSAKQDELNFHKRLLGIDGLIDAQTSSDDAERSKPHPDIFQAALRCMPDIDPTAALVIGDTPYDAQAAHGAGLRTIGVLCGGFPEADLREAGCIMIFRDPSDLLTNYDSWTK